MCLPPNLYAIGLLIYANNLRSTNLVRYIFFEIKCFEVCLRQIQIFLPV